MHVHIGDLEIGTHWTKLNLLHNIRVYMIIWICSSCNNSQNSENLLNCLSDFILNISVLSTVSPCTFSLELEFGIDCLFFFVYILMEACSRGHYYFMEIFIYHSLVSH